MGEVYAAEDTEPGGAVALKALHQQLASKRLPRFRSRPARRDAAS
jgi:hypothetical protein